MMLLASLGMLLQVVAGDTSAERALEHARDAQARFERFRRSNLPRVYARTSRECSVRIGRFCYWYDPGDSTAEPEPPRIGARRLALAATLDSAARIAPANDWITGQRVRYLLEAGKHEDAVAAARACRGEPWWCAALGGLALHVSSARTAADSAFDAALSLMPAAQRCEWSDVSMLRSARRGRTSIQRCEARIAFAERLWVLGQPLWMLPGNDLRAEHLARHTMAVLLQRARNAHALAFGDDSRELLLRYGWAEWFTREDPGFGTYATYSVTGHDREPSFYFLPRVADGAAPRMLDTSAWNVTDPLAPSRYAPRHIERLQPLPHQLARFRRGDSTLIVAVTVSPDSLLGDTAVLALSVLDRAGVRVLTRTTGHLLQAMTSSDTIIASIEAYARGTQRAARSRYSIAPPRCEAWCVSDLLLLRTGQDPGTLDAAMSRALPDATVLAGDAVGIYFEVAQRRESPGRTGVMYGVSVAPLHVSTLRRVGAALRLAPSPDVARIRWAGALESTGGVASQYLAIRLPASARGAYRIQLVVEPQGHAPLTVTRDIRVAR
jgi:hypothetical protein